MVYDGGNMRSLSIRLMPVSVAFCAIGLSGCGGGLLRLPGAILLLSDSRLAGGLYVITPSQEIDVDPGNIGQRSFASLSRDTKIVASRLKKYTSASATGVTSAVATFSLADKDWTEYAEMYSVDAVVISPDGSELAVIGEEGFNTGTFLSVIDTKTRVTRVLTRGNVSGQAAPSWSPDGERLAYQVDPFSSSGQQTQSSIFIVEIKTGDTRKVVDGQYPSWSPSGEWIAYLDVPASGAFGGGRMCRMVRPDGADVRLLADAGGLRPIAGAVGLFGSGRFYYAPIWSPDSTKVLLNRLADPDYIGVDIYLLDIAGQKLTKLTRNGLPVIGWQEAN